MSCNLCNKNINKIEERDHTLYMHVSPNNKRYIGITHTDVERRWKNGEGYKDRNPYFYRSICKYGWENFKHEILFENLTLSEANLLEMFYIAYYDTYNNPSKGYNQTRGGKGCDGLKRTKEQKEYMRNKSKKLGRKVLNFTTEKVYDTVNEAARDIFDEVKSNKIDKVCDSIREVCKGRKKTYAGYEWWYLDEYELGVQKGEIEYKRKSKRDLPVANLDTRITYNSSDEAGKILNINPYNIVRCCEGKSTSCNGNKWVFKDQFDKLVAEGYFDKLDEEERLRKLRNAPKKVVCLNTGEVFNSTGEANKKYGLTSVPNCCNLRSEYAGNINGIKYVWRYEDDYNKLTKEEIDKIINKVNPKKEEKIKPEKKYFVICTTTMEKFYSLKEAGEYYGVHHVNIGKCCRYMRGDDVKKATKHVGYSEDGTPLCWQYYEDYLENGIKIPEERDTSKVPRKRIICLDTNTTYESLTAASKETGISAGSISHCLTGRIKTAGGYRWDYVK